MRPRSILVIPQKAVNLDHGMDDDYLADKCLRPALDHADAPVKITGASFSNGTFQAALQFDKSGSWNAYCVRWVADYGTGHKDSFGHCLDKTDIRPLDTSIVSLFPGSDVSKTSVFGRSKGLEENHAKSGVCRSDFR